VAELNVKITGLVAKDDIRIQRTYSGLPTGITLTKAWLTVKVSKSDPDPGIFQIIITTVAGAGGHITDPASADGDLDLYFDISAAQSALLTPGRQYPYDVQVKDSANKIYTLEIGTIKLEQGATDATS
jgi:hypothetical protein